MYLFWGKLECVIKFLAQNPQDSRRTACSVTLNNSGFWLGHTDRGAVTRIHHICSASQIGWSFMFQETSCPTEWGEGKMFHWGSEHTAANFKKLTKVTMQDSDGIF